VLKGLRDIAPETVEGQMSLLETLDRGSEMSLDLCIQIVKLPPEEIGQSRSDGGLADARNAPNENPHTTSATKRYNHTDDRPEWSVQSMV